MKRPRFALSFVGDGTFSKLSCHGGGILPSPGWGAERQRRPSKCVKDVKGYEYLSLFGCITGLSFSKRSSSIPKLVHSEFTNC